MTTSVQTQTNRIRGDECASVTSDGGYVVALMALLMMPILAFTAFAVDLGAWYAQGTKLQRTADSAALAGVVWLPNTASAESAAQAVLRANGYTGSFSATYPSTRRMTVGIDEDAPQYFSQLFMKGQNLSRDATAEFNKPVPLGSPANIMGNSPGTDRSGDPTCSGSGATCSGVWAAINGPYTAHEQGDPYTTKCTATLSDDVSQRGKNKCDVSSNENGAQNPTYKPQGYTFAVDVPASLVGQTVTVAIYDAINDEGNPNFTGDSIESVASNTGSTFNTQFELFKSDGSDLTVSTSPSLSMSGQCSSGTQGKLLAKSGTSVSTYKNKWVSLCTFIPSIAGVYPLVVKSSNIPSVTDSGAGTNQFSIRATVASGTAPTVYAIDDMSLYTPTANSPGNVSKFYLANIGQEHRGKTLIVDLFDPGDGSSGTYTMQFRTPPGGAPSAVPGDSAGSTSCKYNRTGSSDIGPDTPNDSSNCTITTRNGSSGSLYNNKWLRVKIQIPATYTCTTDCWWTVKYDYGSGSSTDRTVWTVSVVGDPVHLVE
jgi:hypothetical protein